MQGVYISTIYKYSIVYLFCLIKLIQQDPVCKMLKSWTYIFGATFLCWFFTNGVSLQSETYWVRPDTSSECTENISAQFCLTLSELVNTAIDFRENISLNFLPGTHTSNTSGWIEFGRWAKHVSITGNSGNNRALLTEIHCAQRQVGFAFVLLESVSIAKIRLSHCGNLVHNSAEFARAYNPPYRQEDCRLNRSLQPRASILITFALHVTISEVNISNSKGFGVLIIPTGVTGSSQSTITIQNTLCEYSNLNSSSIGGSIAILGIDQMVKYGIDTIRLNATLINVQIRHGKGSRCWLVNNGRNLAVPTAGGLTIFSYSPVRGSINISNSTFTDNEGYDGGGGYIVFPPAACNLNFIISNTEIQNNKALRGGGLFLRLFHTPIYKLQHRPTRSANYIHFNNIEVSSNQADLGGGMFIEIILNGLKYNGASSGERKGYKIQYTINEHCIFHLNQAKKGAGIYTSMPSYEVPKETFTVVLIVRNTVFSENNAGALYTTTIDDHPLSNTHFKIYIKHCYFTRNHGVRGTALYVVNKSFTNVISVVMVRDTKICNNILKKKIQLNEVGTAVYVEQYVLLLSNTIIANNSFRGIHVKYSKIRIQGTVKIINNTATSYNAAYVYGGGIYLDGTGRKSYEIWSRIVLDENATLFVINNKASYGGGIAVSYNGQNENPCFFDYRYQTLEASNIKPAVVMKGNTADIAGSALFGGALESCTVYDETTNLTKEFFSSFFSIEGDNTAIASIPYKVCVCPQNLSHNIASCVKKHSLSVFPGKLFYIPLISVGQWNYPAPSVVRARIRTQNTEIQDELVTQDIGLTCKSIPYQVYTVEDSVVNMTLSIDTAYLRDSSLPTLKNTEVELTILGCPFGFVLSNVSRSCQCSNYHRRKGLQCNIETQTIRKHLQSWIGNYSGEIVIHDHCPFAYCNESHLDVDPYNQQEQCDLNRSGVLCGACQHGHSLALGTSQCKSDCSNVYLLLLIPFALAGIVLIVLLLKCNFTVSTGTINGLILYANIVHENRAIFFLPHIQSTYIYVISVLTAWLNLDFGIEMCFAQNLDEFTRTWLDFVFPVYIWLIIGALILVSRYSITVSRLTGSNTVSVLATLFLLSYTKILRSTFNAFYPAILVTSNGSEHMVWLVDGNFAYLTWPHNLLFTLAFLFLVFFILPFTAILLLSPLIQRYSHKKGVRWAAMRVTPLLDAFHGPYKAKYRNWTGLMLILRIILLITFAANVFGDDLVNLVVLSISLTLLLAIWLKVNRIYRKAWINALELFFLTNLLILTTLTLYFSSTNNPASQRTTVLILLGSALLIGCCILVYHCILALKQLRGVKKLIQNVKSFRLPTRNDGVGNNQDFDLSVQQPSTPRVVTTTVVEITKPLLSDTDQSLQSIREEVETNNTPDQHSQEPEAPQAITTTFEELT